MPCLNDGFQGIGVLIHHVQAQSGIPGIGTESAWCIWNIRLRSHPYHPAAQVLEFFLLPGKMFGLINRPFPNDNVCFLLQNRTHQLLNVRTAVLIVRISVDNDVCTQMQAGIQSCHKTTCQSFVSLKRYNVMESEFPGTLHGVVLAAIVDDQILNGINALYLPGQVVISQLQCLCFIVAGNLYD